MATQLTDKERAAIEAELLAMYEKGTAAADNVDADLAFVDFSDAYDLGFFIGGEFIPSLDSLISGFRESFALLERQERLEVIERKVAVLAPNVVVVTMLTKIAVFAKDGTSWTSPFAQTFVCAKVDDQWKVIHFHQSAPLQT